jgi:hypothetical protein
MLPNYINYPPEEKKLTSKKVSHSTFGKPVAQKVSNETSEFQRDPATEENKEWAEKKVGEKKQIKQPLAEYQKNDYKEGSCHTLLEYGVGRKNVRVLGVGTYAQAKLEGGPYNEKDGLTTKRGFSPFTHVVYLEVLA